MDMKMVGLAALGLFLWNQNEARAAQERQQQREAAEEQRKDELLQGLLETGRSIVNTGVEFVKSDEGKDILASGADVAMSLAESWV